MTKRYPGLGEHVHDERWCGECELAWDGDRYARAELEPQLAKAQAKLASMRVELQRAIDDAQLRESARMNLNSALGVLKALQKALNS